MGKFTFWDNNLIFFKILSWMLKRFVILGNRYHAGLLRRYPKHVQFEDGPKLGGAWFLPPANEVWDKVVFIHPCVILFTGEGWVFKHAMGCTPLGQTLPGQTPLGRHPPRETPRHAGINPHPSTPPPDPASYWNAFFGSLYFECTFGIFGINNLIRWLT